MSESPITRAEKLMSGDTSLTPITREEMFLAKAAGMDVNTPEPITRREKFLSMITGYGQGGGGQGGGTTNLFEYATFANGRVFYNAVFPADTEIDIRVNEISNQNAIFANQFAYARNLVRVKIDFSGTTKAVDMANTFSGCVELRKAELIGASVPFTTAATLFQDCTKLETVTGTINANNLKKAFDKCYLLKDVRFAAGSILSSINFSWSTQLTDESVQSIIDGLADLTGGTAQTLTLSTDVKANLTEDQISAITGKNWTLA